MGFWTGTLFNKTTHKKSSKKLYKQQIKRRWGRHLANLSKLFLVENFYGDNFVDERKRETKTASKHHRTLAQTTPYIHFKSDLQLLHLT